MKYHVIALILPLLIACPPANSQTSDDWGKLKQQVEASGDKYEILPTGEHVITHKDGSTERFTPGKEGIQLTMPPQSEQQIEESKAQYYLALKDVTDKLSDEDPLTYTNLNEMAPYFVRSNDLERGLSCFLRLDSICKSKYGAKAAETFHTEMAIGELLMRTGRYGDAEPYFLNNLDFAEKTLTEPVKLATVLNNAAYTEAQLGKLERAERLYKSALTNLAKESDPRVKKKVVDGLTDVLRKLNRDKEAESILKMQGAI